MLLAWVSSVTARMEFVRFRLGGLYLPGRSSFQYQCTDQGNDEGYREDLHIGHQYNKQRIFVPFLHLVHFGRFLREFICTDPTFFCFGNHNCSIFIHKIRHKAIVIDQPTYHIYCRGDQRDKKADLKCFPEIDRAGIVLVTERFDAYKDH